ncbi:MAG: hypothetical protein ACJ77M_10825 [Thermoleophilaceae bacterium]
MKLLERAAPPPSARAVELDSAPRRPRVFPGDRRVWLTAAAVGGLLLCVLVVELLVPRDFYTGTNSIRTLNFAGISAGKPLCVPNLLIPPGTGRIEINANGGTTVRGAMSGVLYAGGRAIRAADVPPGPVGQQKADFAIPKTRSALPGATFCITGHGSLFVGGAQYLQGNDFSPTVGGQQLGWRIALWFRPPAGQKRSYLSLLPTMLRRVAIFRPGVVGAWTYWVLLLLVLPALAYFAVRLLATAGLAVRRRVPLALALALLAFVNAGAWALVTPAFDAPDESEHFAYAQYLAETGHAVGGTGKPYSSDQIAAIEATRIFSSNQNGDGKPPWTSRDQAAWEKRTQGKHADRADGGLASVATGAHSPLYYSLLAPAYWVTHGWSIWSQLTAMRLVSSLLGALVAALAFLLLRELLPRYPVVAVAGGLLVAFQPMFSFMSGAINNDMGVNAAAAALLYLLIRALRRGLTLPLAIAIGVVLTVAPLMKASGYELWPAAAVALIGVVCRGRGRGSRLVLRDAAVALATCAALFVAWKVLAPTFHRATFAAPGGSAPGGGYLALHHPFGYLNYLWQVFLPKLWFVHDLWNQRFPAFDIYAVRGWGSFGWYAMTFAHWVYQVILAVMLIAGALTAGALWRHRGGALRRVGWEVLVLVTAIAGVIGGVHAFYYTQTPRGGIIAEMGRYSFPAIVALAAAALGGAFFFRRRSWVAPYVTGLAVSVVVLCYSSQLLAIGRFYGLT